MLWLAAATTILVLGDSHVSGPTSAPAGQPFPTVLQEILGEDFEVRSAGCAGSSTRDWTEDWTEEEIAGWERDGKGSNCPWGGAYDLARPHLPVDIAVVLLGSNDAVGFAEPRRLGADGLPKTAPIPMAEYRERMVLLLDRLRADGARRVVLMAPPARRDGHRVRTTRLRVYARVLSDLAGEREDATLGPDLYRLLQPEDFHGNAIHMNGPGHRKVAEALAPVLRSTAAALPPRRPASRAAAEAQSAHPE